MWLTRVVRRVMACSLLHLMGARGTHAEELGEFAAAPIGYHGGDAIGDATSGKRPPIARQACVRRGGHHFATSITQGRPRLTRYNRSIRTVRFPVNTREHEGSQDIR